MEGAGRRRPGPFTRGFRDRDPGRLVLRFVNVVAQGFQIAVNCSNAARAWQRPDLRTNHRETIDNP